MEVGKIALTTDRIETTTGVHPEMALFLLSGILRGFPPATYLMYASVKTLVRPCSEEKWHISELDTA